MAKANKYNVNSNPSLKDLLFGSKSEDGKDQNITIESIVNLLNAVSGKDYIQYKFSPTDYSSIGSFTSNASTTNPTQISKLFFNKKSAAKEDLTALFTKLDTLQNIVIELRNPSNSNNFATFKITNITVHTEYFELDVVLYKSFFSGQLTSGVLYSAYFDVKENFEDKLNQGAYVGSAQTLNTDIQNRVLKEDGKSLVSNTEIEKLVNLDNTKDVDKPLSNPQKTYVDTTVQAQIVGSTVIGDPNSILPPTGNIHSLGAGPGTYSNWGGMVIPANNIGTLKRVSGVYSVDLTPVDFTGYPLEEDLDPDVIMLPPTFQDVLTTHPTSIATFGIISIPLTEPLIVGVEYKMTFKMLTQLNGGPDSVFRLQINGSNPSQFIWTLQTVNVDQEYIETIIAESDNTLLVLTCENFGGDIAITFEKVARNSELSKKFKVIEEDYAKKTDLDEYIPSSELINYVKKSDLYINYYPTETVVTGWTNGFYVDKNNGTLQPNGSFRYKELVIDSSFLIRFSIYNVFGAPIVAVVAFYDELNVFISAPYVYNAGATDFLHEVIAIPVNTKKIVFCTPTYNDLYYSIGGQHQTIDSILKDKNGLWIGTSIPTGQDERKYPEQIGSRLSMANMYNKAIGSSAVRKGADVFGQFSALYSPVWIPSSNSYVSSSNGALIPSSSYEYAEYPCDESIVLSFSFNSNLGSNVVSLVSAYDVNGTFISSIYTSSVAPIVYTDALITLPIGTRKIRFCRLKANAYTIKLKDVNGWFGGHWYGVGVGLAQTIEEKHNYINNYEFYKSFLSTSIPDITAFATQFIEASYENRLVTPEIPNFLFFNHGFNDIGDPSSIDYTVIPPDSRDKNTFIGAANFIIDRVLEINPNVRIVFIGHYQGDDARSINIRTALTTLSQYWSAPFYDLSKKLNWCNQLITVAGSWVSGVWTPGANTTMTLKNYYIPDEVHPHTDLSGKAINLITETLIYELRNL